MGTVDERTLEMDNKMNTLLAYQQANGSVGDFLVYDINLPLEDRRDLDLLETRLCQILGLHRNPHTSGALTRRHMWVSGSRGGLEEGPNVFITHLLCFIYHIRTELTTLFSIYNCIRADLADMIPLIHSPNLFKK